MLHHQSATLMQQEDICCEGSQLVSGLELCSSEKYMLDTVNQVQTSWLGRSQALQFYYYPTGPTTAVLLNRHVVELPFKYLHLYTEIRFALSLDGRSFYLQ